MLRYIALVPVLIHVVCYTEGSNLCVKNDASCTDQLWTNSSNASLCHMTYYKLNSAECASMVFQNKIDRHELGNVKLSAFTSEQYQEILFSVKFQNILWNEMLMRFASTAHPNEKNMCRRFTILENVTVSNLSALIYECPWFTAAKGDYERKDFLLEYEYLSPSVEHSRIIFKVPIYDHYNSLTDIKTLQIFTYIDVTDSEYLELHIQLAPAAYNITHYLVEVVRERSNTSARLTVQIVSANEAIDDELIFSYPMWNEFGYFYFNVSPISKVCKENECWKSSTPKYLVGRKKSSLVIGIVGASVILFALFYSMFFWSRKKNHDEKTPARALLIYNVSIKSHCYVIESLASFLQELLHIEVLLDVLDIPRTNHKDPLRWLNHAFSYATHIVYVASPETSSCSQMSDNIYKIHGAALKFMKSEIVCDENTKQMYVLTLPYSANRVPAELANLRRFALMKDMDGFINNLVIPPYQSWTFLNIYRPNRFRGTPQYTELENAIEAAQKEVAILSECVTPTSCGPKITITKSSTDKFAGNGEEEEEEGKKLLHKEPYAYPISDLDLSGEGSQYREKEEQSTSYSIDFQSMNL